MKPISHDMSNTRTPTHCPVFSSEKALMDYTTVKGIHQRTGVDKPHLIPFVLKELLDNAVDFIEKYGRNNSDHIVKVKLTKGKILVTNSNFGIEPFTGDMLESIFSFDRFYSEKRNIYKISRGNLGDALKEILCVPYALALSEQIEDWNEPLVITGNKLSHTIHLTIDRVEQTVTANIQTQAKMASEEELTTVEFRFPFQERTQKIGKDLVNVLIDYGVLNSHISFDYNFYPDADDPADDGLYGKWKEFLPQTQKINPEWLNRPSTWYYNFDEFKQFINGLEDNEAVIYDVLKSLNFREITNIARNDKDAGMTDTVRQLKVYPKIIYKVYDRLRGAIDPSTKLKTQFDINKQTRRDAIKKRIEQFGFIVRNAKYRLVHCTYNSNDHEIKFPFIFEVGMFYTSMADSYTIDGINSSYRPNSPFIGKYRNTYTWISGRGQKQNTAASVSDILTKYGYSNSKEQSRKAAAFIVINLISPRIDYEGYSKSHINLEPFADTIAETVYKIASESAPTGSDGKRTTGRDIVEEILKERLLAVRQNKDLLVTDKWTQSSVYYRARKRMLERGVRLTERKTITQQISDICDEWKIKRESIGIFAADRAQLYFRGEIHDVGIGELHDLKQRGTDLIIIEKEGVAEVLSPFAERYGIAILNTRGFLTDYAKDLSELSEHVTIITDLDDSGLVLANKVPDVPRIGIDLETLQHFELEREKVEEEYSPGDHYKNLLNLSKMGELDSEIDDLLKEIENTRIEIDSILVEVGNEKFWEFILEKLEDLWENRNYRRAIKTPKGIVPDAIEFEQGRKAKMRSDSGR